MVNDDVLIVGAGPAGTVAATLLARAGARVRLIDRATFPRDKLCGDTINPGTLAALAQLGMSHSLEGRGLPVDGMRLTGPSGIAVESRYPHNLQGRALVRHELDAALLDQAIAAGARFESGATVKAPLVDGRRTTIVRGVVLRSRAGGELRAPVTIAADGRHSTLGFSLGIARHPVRPRRWAIGGYYERTLEMSSLGEMHVRRGYYVGVAPVPGGLTNVCLVKPVQAGHALGSLAGLLQEVLARDVVLRDRFANARLVRPPVVLGPLAVDVIAPPPQGLILAGDAAGFIDPMTGDGLGFAVRGGALAAVAALEALGTGWIGVHERLRAARRAAFAPKMRFNRTLRALVASVPLIDVGSVTARILPGAFRRLVAEAGDCRLAEALARSAPTAA